VNPLNDVFLNEKTQKKMFFPNIFMNSEEFKDLGTLHQERRNQDYPNEGDFGSESSRRKTFGGTGSEFLHQISAGGNPVKRWVQK
jgi:hypothetical protein